MQKGTAWYSIQHHKEIYRETICHLYRIDGLYIYSDGGLFLLLVVIRFEVCPLLGRPAIVLRFIDFAYVSIYNLLRQSSRMKFENDLQPYRDIAYIFLYMPIRLV